MGEAEEEEAGPDAVAAAERARESYERAQHPGIGENRVTCALVRCKVSAKCASICHD